MAAKYVLLATVFYMRQEDGSRKRFQTGDVVEGLNTEQVERLLRAKAIGSPADLPADEPEAEAEGNEGGKPDDDATKAELIAWLVENAIDADGEDYTTSKLQPLNKAALWELINAVED